MSKNYYYFICSLLLATGWANALAQGTPAVSPAQRLKLDLVDNRSTFVINEQQGTYENHYVNTLSLSQPTDNKLTAGMLNEGNNYIVFTRQGDTETAPTEFARINLSATSVQQEAKILTDFEFTSNTISASGWTVSSSRALSYSSYYQGTRINSGSNYYIRYTIPQVQGVEYDGGTFLLNIGTYTAGYFKINGTTTAQTTANSWNQYSLTGLNVGSTITIYGASSSGGNGNSPYMAGIYIVWVPPTIVPTINVTSTYSQKEGNNWVNVSTLGSNTYSPNDNVNANSFNVDVIDTFNESTENNNRPNSYNYSVDMDAHIDWTDMTGDYYASVDFTKGDGDDLTTPEFIGPNNWDYLLVSYYIPQNGTIPALYLNGNAELIYTMPPTFSGNSVNVSVTSTNHSYGAGNLMVNNVNHEFAAGETYTWTNVPVSAGGVIQFKMKSGDQYTCDIAKIIIQSGNGSASNAPQSQSVVPSLKQQANNSFLNGKDYSIKTKKMSAKK
jgi:hypothetical protein